MNSLINIYPGNSLHMKEIPDESVQLIVTSPPYWQQRVYDVPDIEIDGWRGQFGLERDPRLYIKHSMLFLREMWRVLRKDGVLLYNIGDKYITTKGTCHNPGGGMDMPSAIAKKKEGVYPLDRGNIVEMRSYGLKPKDLALIPERFVLAAQEPYEDFTIKELADRAWLAGIVDGEGTIGIHHRLANLDGYKFHKCDPFLGIGSSDTCIIDHIIEITKHEGSRQKEDAGQDKRGMRRTRPHYEWRAEGKEAINIIQDIYPYLVLKEQQARIAYAVSQIEYPHPRQGRKIPEKATEEKLRLWQLCKACNQRKDVTVDLPKVTRHIEPGWTVRSEIIWHKENCAPESVKDRPSTDHEFIFMLTKGPKYYWNYKGYTVPTVRPGELNNFAGKKYRQENLIPTGDPQDRGEHSQYTGRTWRTGDERPIRSVWEFATQGYRGKHRSVFPEKLAEICIKLASREGDLVLDPFCGTGTVLWVAKCLGRRGVGYELSEKYLAMARERNAQMTTEEV